MKEQTQIDKMIEKVLKSESKEILVISSIRNTGKSNFLKENPSYKLVEEVVKK